MDIPAALGAIGLAITNGATWWLTTRKQKRRDDSDAALSSRWRKDAEESRDRERELLERISRAEGVAASAEKAKARVENEYVRLQEQMLHQIHETEKAKRDIQKLKPHAPLEVQNMLESEVGEFDRIKPGTPYPPGAPRPKGLRR